MHDENIKLTACCFSAAFQISCFSRPVPGKLFGASDVKPDKLLIAWDTCFQSTACSSQLLRRYRSLLHLGSPSKLSVLPYYNLCIAFD